MTDEFTQNEVKIPSTVITPLWVAAVAMLLSSVALSVWATTAPISTTIRANGTLASAKPSYSMQHAFGGKINQINVSVHDNVSAGQELLSLDISSQQKNLQLLDLQISQIETENLLINKILTEGSPSAATINRELHTSLELRYSEKHAQLTTALKANQKSLQSTKDHLQEAQEGLVALNARIRRAEDRADKLNSLSQKGIVSEREIEAQRDLLLELDTKKSTEEANLITIGENIAQAKLKEESLKTDYRLSLLDQLFQNRKRLPDLLRSQLALKTEIDAASVKSPIYGKVVAIQYDTDQMYVAKGSTIITLAQSLDQPRVKMIIPTHSIDQVRLGMTGTLTIPSLPQRNLPQIRVEVTSIAPDATKGEDGSPIGYSAQALISPNDLKEIKTAIGDLQLATDMPVSLALQGRATTFSEYLFGPFFKMFQGALQD